VGGFPRALPWAGIGCPVGAEDLIRWNRRSRAHDEHIFSPANFSNHWLEIWKRPIFGIELPHQPKIGDGKSAAAGELQPEVVCECFDNRFSPTEHFLLLINGLSQVPVERKKLFVNGPQGLVLGETNALLDCHKKSGIVV